MYFYKMWTNWHHIYIDWSASPMTNRIKTWHYLELLTIFWRRFSLKRLIFPFFSNCTSTIPLVASLQLYLWDFIRAQTLLSASPSLIPHFQYKPPSLLMLGQIFQKTSRDLCQACKPFFFFFFGLLLLRVNRECRDSGSKGQQSMWSVFVTTRELKECHTQKIVKMQSPSFLKQVLNENIRPSLFFTHIFSLSLFL